MRFNMENFYDLTHQNSFQWRGAVKLFIIKFKRKPGLSKVLYLKKNTQTISGEPRLRGCPIAEPLPGLVFNPKF